MSSPDDGLVSVRDGISLTIDDEHSGSVKCIEIDRESFIMVNFCYLFMKRFMKARIYPAI